VLLTRTASDFRNSFCTPPQNRFILRYHCCYVYVLILLMTVIMVPTYSCCQYTTAGIFICETEAEKPEGLGAFIQRFSLAGRRTGRF
jgi:hypothetical protein